GADGTPGADGADGADGANGTSCTAADNPDGSKTITCEDGTTFTVRDGEAGASGGRVEIQSFHGEEYLGRSGEYTDGAKTDVDVTITSATADAAGLVTVDFSVATRGDEPEPVTSVAAVSGSIAKLEPPSGGDSSTRWVSYIYRTQTVTAGAWPAPAGTSAVQATSESSGTDPGRGTLTNNGDGTYRYVYATNLMTAMRDGSPVGYDRALTHRVSIMMGGHSGPTGNANFDFVPDGSALTLTRNIVQTATCQNCHGSEFHGHGGNRLTVENCVTCHNPGNYDPNGADGAGFPGETIDARVMFHRIHAGGEVASIPGADGIVWDNPTTSADESADNGTYRIWGNRDTMHEWWKVGFPANISNCRTCHQGTGEDVEAWRENPSRAACGSCHDDVDFVTGVNHPGGEQLTDDDCGTCHTPSGRGVGMSVTDAHDWLQHDPRNIPEFTASLTVSRPANGTHFVAGESPVITLVLSEGGTPINHTTVVGDDPAAEGCTRPGPCPPRDGLFRTAALFVHGPRANRVPVLTTAARAAVVATGPGPFDLSAAGASLSLSVDMGRDTRYVDATGGDRAQPGNITVTVASAAAGTFPTPAAVTTAQMVTWLNANTNFARRAIAYTQGGNLAIRSRNLGPVHAIQLRPSVVTTVVFGDDMVPHMPTGSTTGNNIAARSNPANNDPKAVRTAGSITYTLDPVDDLEPGTYIADVEIADAGNNSDSDYRTPTVARVSFQVGQADEEPLIARNCSTCHQGPDGTGFVLDWRRHNKIFNDTAIDQCGNCHDYQPQYSIGSMTAASGSTPAGPANVTSWSGSRPISRRVHAIHFGSSLDHALDSVDYSNGDPIPGRNWDITFPRDVRDCESCHTAETSGTWATRPGRLPCSGCHDSDAAMSHMRLMTYDPTPTAPYSGDEQESCATCHVANSGGTASTDAAEE
ncbi:MAG: OmcA/MtrC family decaheme c-type cytochrome, partial [Deltaproteobacteria bacterium]|nr:OmcA/MtrC family decaheme c-type cytochrome [Deltaproteobacteria bacterium]